MLPNSAVLNVLESAYEPCGGFAGACREMRWIPGDGHVPRGFAGALGSLGDVRLVLVTAEPGDPYDTETYPSGMPKDVLESACHQVFRVLETGNDRYHQNLRYILDGCFPGLDFREQLRRTWITDAVLCSATVEGGNVSAATARECRGRYLEAQLGLFPNAMVVALGSKARYRLKGWPDIATGYSVAPPGCNRRRARPSWDAVIASFHARPPNKALQLTGCARS